MSACEKAQNLCWEGCSGVKATLQKNWVQFPQLGSRRLQLPVTAAGKGKHKAVMQSVYSALSFL